MRSKEYWEGRFIDLQRSQLKRADSFAHELEDLHARMQKEIEDDITVWHKKVATANGISMVDAKKLMSRKDRKEFQWTLEEYEQHAKADLLSGVTSANVLNASANWHLSYLDGMKLQLEHHVDKLYKNIDSKTRNHFKESLNENYLNTAFELQKGIGIGEKMEVPYDERKLENILRTPWANDGKNFSQRIWKDRTQLVNNLQKHLSESVIRGDSDTDMIQALSKDEKKAEFNTRRLVETESAFFDSESERQCCEDFGIEKYRFLAVLDMKTSDICQELDNKVFLEKDRQVGVNAPPMHPFCRSTTAPVIDEDFLTSRRAKNPKTGEYDEIPPEMNYKQWKEKYVEGKENAEEVKQEQVQTESSNGYEIKLENKNVDNQYFDTPLESKTSEFDSKGYNNRVEGKAEKRAEKLQELQNKQAKLDEKANHYLEKIKKNDSIPKDIVLETENLINELRENTNNIIKQKQENIKSFQFQVFPSVVKDKAIKYLNANYKEITNIFLDDLDDDTVKPLKSCIDKINDKIVKATGKKIALPINTIASAEKLYDLVIEDFKKKYYNESNESNDKELEIEAEDELKSILHLDTNSNTFAFSPVPPYVSSNNFYDYIGTKRRDLNGVYFLRDKIKVYNKETKNNNRRYPPNCKTIQGAFNHEVGHNFDYSYDLANNYIIRFLFHKELENYKFFIKNIENGDNEEEAYNKLLAKTKIFKNQFDENNLNEYQPKEFTSRYSFENIQDIEEIKEDIEENSPEIYREFIAENISEYLTSPTPRDTSKIVWNILIKKINTTIPRSFYE